MAEIEARFPSGLVARVRGMKGKDYRNLAGASKLSGSGVSQLLQSCVVEVVDQGPYAQRAIPWDSEALVGDRLFGLVTIRRATYPGEQYAFDVPCSLGRSCRKIEWKLDLNDLPVRELPEDARARFAAGENRFDTATSSGQRVSFKLMQAADYKKQRRIIDAVGPSAQGLLLSLATRIVEVDGLRNQDVRTVFDWLDDLELSEHRTLVAAFDAVDCGIETEIEVECPWCKQEQTITLPFGRTFLNPQAATPGSSRRSIESSS